jgi:hypothetical protein
MRRPAMLIAAASLVAGACSPAIPARFSGKEQPRIVAADQVEVFEGRDAPDGFKVFGVTTTSCDTYNGATGLFEAKCSQDALMDALKARAAEAGGGMLVEPTCAERTLEKSLERVDARGGANSPSVPGTMPAPTTGGKINRRVRLECQASVARPISGVMPKVLPPPRPTASSAPSDSERVRIGDVDVTIHAERDAAAPPQEPRPVEELGDMDHAPDGYPRIGKVSAECQSGCSIGAARRALKHAAAKLGAIAVVESSCEPLSDRWRCQAVAVGEGK